MTTPEISLGRHVTTRPAGNKETGNSRGWLFAVNSHSTPDQLTSGKAAHARTCNRPRRSPRSATHETASSYASEPPRTAARAWSIAIGGPWASDRAACAADVHGGP